jgi:hypothetical protein
VSAKPEPIAIDPTSELGHALAEANGHPIYLISDGVRYRISRDPEDIWAGYDPDQVLAAIDEIAGTITPEEGTRPIDQP